MKELSHKQPLSNRAEFFAGVLNELPLLLGVFPFGMIYGILALQAFLPPTAAQAMSSLIFAGSAQFISAQLLGQGVPMIVLVGTVLVVNLRHMLYSASIAPYTRHLSKKWKAVLAYFLTDETYVIAIAHYNEDTPVERKHWYYLGAGVTLWLGWQVASAAGIFLGAQVPPSWSLDFALALTFISLVVPALKDRPAVVAALTAGIVALVAYSLPFKLGLIIAAFFGIVSGLISERLWK